MNILIVNWQDRHNPYAGGAEVHLHEIFGRIAAWGHKVTLLASGFPGAKKEETVDRIHVVRKGSRNDFNFFVPSAIREIVGRENIDILVEDLNKIPFFTPMFMKIPTVAILHHRFGKSIFTETILPFAMYVYIAESMIPVVYRNIPFDVVSESTKDDLVASGISAERIFIHYNGIDRSMYKPGKGKKHAFQIAFLGRIKKYKTIEHLLYAVVRLRNEFSQLRVMVVGDGDALPDLKRIAGSLKIEGIVNFTGFVSANEKVRILQESEIVVNTSSKEGWGLTVIESNACGIPVVAADSPGLRDSVKDGFNGLLYPYGDISILTESIKKLLKNSKLLERLQNNAIEWSKKFDWEKSARGVLEILTKRLSGEI